MTKALPFEHGHCSGREALPGESKSEVAQSCPTLRTLRGPMDCSLPGSSLHGILQARVLEWVAISFSRGSSWPRDQTQVSRIPGRRFNLWATREAQENCPWVLSTLIWVQRGLGTLSWSIHTFPTMTRRGSYLTLSFPSNHSPSLIKKLVLLWQVTIYPPSVPKICKTPCNNNSKLWDGTECLGCSDLVSLFIKWPPSAMGTILLRIWEQILEFLCCQENKMGKKKNPTSSAFPLGPPRIWSTFEAKYLIS